MPNLFLPFHSNNQLTPSDEIQLGPITIAFRRAITKTLDCIELGFCEDFAKWRVAEQKLTPFERIFYEFALRRPCMLALLPPSKGERK